MASACSLLFFHLYKDVEDGLFISRSCHAPAILFYIDDTIGLFRGDDVTRNSRSAAFQSLMELFTTFLVVSFVSINKYNIQLYIFLIIIVCTTFFDLGNFFLSLFFLKKRNSWWTSSVRGGETGHNERWSVKLASIDVISDGWQA